MKPQLLTRKNPFDRSFTAQKHSYSNFLNVWHYHPELELVYILESTGTRFIGDSIQKFKKGDLVLLGENLPHLWQNDPEYFHKDSGLMAEAYSIHFNKHFAGGDFFSLPEMDPISTLFQTAMQGILFTGPGRDKAASMLPTFIISTGYRKFICLLELLMMLAQETDFELLSSKGFTAPLDSTDGRMGKIYSFTFAHFKQNITLEEVASRVALNPTAFCRYFKGLTKKTYSQFLNEIRIGFACKLLMEGHFNISEVAFESGFNNLSNFNRQFKNKMALSPSQYLKLRHQLNHEEAEAKKAENGGIVTSRRW